MEPSEIVKRVAGGRIPISFDMHESEVTSLHRPPTFYIMAPRQSYLPLVARSARESFEEAAPDVGEYGVWFETEGRPLRWNIPVGTLYDFHQADKGDLPFKVTIRFQGFPKGTLLPCSGEVDCENQFFNSMKQALSLRFGSAKKLMEMPKVQQENLWEGIVFGKFDRYWQSCASLLTSGDDVSAEDSSRYQVPLRVLVKSSDATSYENGARALQAAVSFSTPNLTLKDAIDTVLRSNARELSEEDWTRTKIFVQGVSPPLDAPIKEVIEEMSAHDLFLYVVVLVS